MPADWVFEPSGAVDLMQVEELRDRWYAVVDEWEPEQVIVDLRSVDVVDSSGLGLLAGLAKRQRAHDGWVTIRNASPVVVRGLVGNGLADAVQLAPAR